MTQNNDEKKKDSPILSIGVLLGFFLIITILGLAFIKARELYRGDTIDNLPKSAAVVDKATDLEDVLLNKIREDQEAQKAILIKWKYTYIDRITELEEENADLRKQLDALRGVESTDQQ